MSGASHDVLAVSPRIGPRIEAAAWTSPPPWSSDQTPCLNSFGPRTARGLDFLWRRQGGELLK